MRQASEQAGEHGLPAGGGEPEETDAGPTEARRALTRLCLAGRTVRPVGEMLRFVVAPDGRVVPDLAGKLPGRGAWVGATRAELELALKKKAFGRAFRGKGRAEAGLIELVDALLEKDVLGALGFANKAGQLVTGTTKVAEALTGGAAILVHASDAARDGVAKLDALARRVGEAEGKEIAFVNSLSGVQLDLALGRANVVHAALLAHPTSAGFLARVRRLESWRAG
ncbi:RNA-binding protein [Ancylobacter oerskovii]|uniref:RNA-binding protein n=1 Tax=Ancylobacter oerskovii TaxID=459519 RepID=A0ABW4YV98_9HYPH|nr:RNA-binding protein [Ancylobacter oerskovii]MBS7544561.1 RNA-binding protein [Ancylobacter oerskovii]